MDKPFSSFKNYWQAARKDYWTNMPSYQWQGILFLATMYFCQLGLMSVINTIKMPTPDLTQLKDIKSIESNARYLYYFGTIIGAFCMAGALAYIRKRKTKDSIRWVLGMSHLFFTIFCFVLVIAFKLNPGGFPKLIYYPIKFCIGFTNSAFIGIAITWVVESVYKHLRTMSALFIGLFGYWGATISSLFTSPPRLLQEFVTSHSKYNMYNYKIQWYGYNFGSETGPISDLVFTYILVVITFSVYLALRLNNRKTLLSDATLVQKYYEKTDNKRGFVSGNSRIIVFSLLLGITVQYFLFMSENFGKFFDTHDNYNLKETFLIIPQDRYKLKETFLTIPQDSGKISALKSGSLFKTKILQDSIKANAIVEAELNKLSPAFLNAAFYRFLGTTIGSLILILLHIQLNKKMRRRDILFGGILGIIFLLFLSLLIHFECNDKNKLILYDDIKLWSFAFGTGLLSCIWVLCILHIAEQFDLQYRPWMIILAPNVYRVSQIILSWRTHETTSAYSNDLYTGILWWGVIFATFSLLAVLVLKKGNYEGDALWSGVDEEGKINSFELLQEIMNNTETDEKTYFNNANEILTTHFKDVFDMQYYMNAIYFLNHSKIDNTKFNTIPDTFDSNKVNAEYKSENANAVHNISLALVNAEEDSQGSFVSALLGGDTKYKGYDDNCGGLLYRSGIKGREMKIKNDAEIKMLQIDLCEYELEANLLTQLHNKLRQSDSKAPDTKGFELTEFKVDSKHPQDLQRTFALFRIDAEAYEPEKYFLYIIKPVTSKPVCALVLKTTVELDTKDIKRLVNVVTHIQGKWSELSAKSETQSLQKLFSNALNSHFIKNMTIRLGEHQANLLKEFKKLHPTFTFDNNKSEELHKRAANLFISYMSIAEPQITLGKEQELLNNYLALHLMMQQHKISGDNDVIESSVKSILATETDKAIDLSILNWNFTVSSNHLDYGIPRMIVQPLLENAFAHSGYFINEFDKLELRISITDEGNNTVKIEVEHEVKGDVQKRISIINQAKEGRLNRGKPKSLYLIAQSVQSQNKSTQEGYFYPEASKIGDTKLRMTILLKNCERIQKKKREIENAEQRPDDLETKRVLIIDDNVGEIKDIKEKIIKDDDIPDIKIVQTITNFEDAEQFLLDETKREKIDLVITDLCLSDLPSNNDKWSTEILKKINQKGWGETGIIIVSTIEEAILTEVDKEMKGLLPKNYLGSIHKLVKSKK
jgi:hypothetical protein